MAQSGQQQDKIKRRKPLSPGVETELQLDEFGQDQEVVEELVDEIDRLLGLAENQVRREIRGCGCGG